MTTDIEPLLAAFLTGFTGSVHCAGMCGGIAGALALGATPTTSARRALLLIGYNLGRIATYTLIGATLGGLAGSLQHLLHGTRLPLVLSITGAALLALTGLYIGWGWQGLAPLERAGMRIWRHVEPIGRRFLPVRNAATALAAGFVWGWLPCGMVYTALAFAITAANPVESAARMFAFGLGTLPMLLAAGWMAQRLASLTRQPWLRRLAGLTILATSVALLIQAAASAPGGHGHH